MSKLKEYLNLLPKGLANIDKVFEGVVNEVKMKYFSLPEDEQEEIIRRRLICNTCPLNSLNAKTSQEYKDLFNGESYVSERDDLHCSICHCNIELKSSSLSSDCGLSTYNLEHPDNIQELKFKKYKN